MNVDATPPELSEYAQRRAWQIADECGQSKDRTPGQGGQGPGSAERVGSIQ